MGPCLSPLVQVGLRGRLVVVPDPSEGPARPVSSARPPTYPASGAPDRRIVDDERCPRSWPRAHRRRRGERTLAQPRAGFGMG